VQTCVQETGCGTDAKGHSRAREPVAEGLVKRHLREIVGAPDELKSATRFRTRPQSILGSCMRTSLGIKS